VAITLQSFSVNDTDYIAKLNNNIIAITNAINGLQAATGNTVFGAVNQTLLTMALFGSVTTVIGTSSYVATISGTNLNISIGMAWFPGASVIVVSGSVTVLAFAGLAAGTYYVMIDGTGVPSIQTTNTTSLYSVTWTGTGFSDIELLANVLFSAADEVATLDSVTNATSYSTLEARLEAIETAVKMAITAGGGGTTHSEPLTDGNGNFIFAGDIITVIGVTN
jgi:hypothetical protein